MKYTKCLAVFLFVLGYTAVALAQLTTKEPLTVSQMDRLARGHG